MVQFDWYIFQILTFSDIFLNYFFNTKLITGSYNLLFYANFAFYSIWIKIAEDN